MFDPCPWKEGHHDQRNYSPCDQCDQPQEPTEVRRRRRSCGGHRPAVSVPAGAADTGDRARVLPLPTPIPGGLQIPGLPLLHVFPPGLTLPFSGAQLPGLDVEPSVITNYTGTTAVAFHVGSAVGSDGARYGSTNVPATVSFAVRWTATGARHPRGRGATVPPTDPAAFLGGFATARSTGSFSGSQLGFSFRSTSATTDRGYAQFGRERNGSSL
jgi:hypothetical protein